MAEVHLSGPMPFQQLAILPFLIYQPSAFVDSKSLDAYKKSCMEQVTKERDGGISIMTNLRAAVGRWGSYSMKDGGDRGQMAAGGNFKQD